MRSEQEVNNAIELYADMVKRLCMVHLKNETDTEDIFQTVFIKYLENDIKFENKNHEKAWIIRVTINACKDYLKSFFRSKTVSIDTYLEKENGEELSIDNKIVLEAVLGLPEKYKNVVYLYYYEGYEVSEISKILNKKVNTIYTLLTRARNILKEKIGGEDYEW